MMNIGRRKKGILLKQQKRLEKIWLSSAEMKYTGKQDGKIVLMVQVLLFVPWYVIKKVHCQQPRKMPVADKCDVSTNEWTGLWRDGCNYTGVTDACKPENALSGQISWDGIPGTITVPDTYKNLRFWRNTAVATLGTGATQTLTQWNIGIRVGLVSV